MPLIEDTQQSLQQVLQMVTRRNRYQCERKGSAYLGRYGFCVHGDGLHALEFVKEIRGMLNVNGIEMLEVQ